MPIEQAHPFLRWAGGKTTLVPQILERIPATWNRETDLYVEPFLGGGAVFFALQPKRALLNDINFQLVSLYHNVARNPKFWDTFVQVKAPYTGNPEATYAAVRENYNVGIRLAPMQSDQSQAARLLKLPMKASLTNTGGWASVPTLCKPNATSIRRVPAAGRWVNISSIEKGRR